MKIVAGVGDLVQKTGDDHTGWKLGDQAIEWSGGYRTRGDEEREFLV
jgi:hypothetical protein